MSSPALVRLRDRAFGARAKLLNVYFKVSFQSYMYVDWNDRAHCTFEWERACVRTSFDLPPLVLDLPLVLQLELDMGTKGNSNLPWKIPDTSGQMKRILGSSEFKDLPNSWGNNIRVLVCFNMSEHQQFSNTHKLLLLQASGFEASQPFCHRMWVGDPGYFEAVIMKKLNHTSNLSFLAPQVL